jgi:hypothetical protein
MNHPDVRAVLSQEFDPLRMFGDRRADFLADRV